MAEQSRSQKRKKRKQRRKLAKKLWAAVVSVIMLLTLFIMINEKYLHLEGVPTVSQIKQSIGLLKRPKIHVEQDEIAVHFIDVGQGDCALIKTPEKNVLIDCGEESESGSVISYLRDFGVKRLDMVIVSHPHSDHSGGMHRILSEFDTGEILMPQIAEEDIPAAAFYEKMLDVIEEKDIAAYYAIQGQRFELCEGTYIEILGPLGDNYDDLNNYSVVAKLVSGNYSFLFTGDMEKTSEEELMEHWINVSADVLKVAHHGSSSSSTSAFLKRVRPQYAVISVGEGNSYGHPSGEVLGRLKALGSEIITTMDSGDIVFVTDGNELRYVTANDSEEAA